MAHYPHELCFAGRRRRRLLVRRQRLLWGIDRYDGELVAKSKARCQGE
jgi:hypothetical protein